MSSRVSMVAVEGSVSGGVIACDRNGSHGKYMTKVPPDCRRSPPGEKTSTSPGMGTKDKSRNRLRTEIPYS
jgi:hypothetical protein